MMPAQANQSLINGFLVLQEVISAGRPIGSREVARRLDMEHSTINRLLKTLLVIGMLQQDRESKYSPGPRIHVISALSLHASGLITASLPVLEPIHRMGAVVALGSVWRQTVVYFLHAYPDQDLSHSVGVHESYPVNKSIIGSVLGPGSPRGAWEDRPERNQRAWGARIGEFGAAAIAVVLPLDHQLADPPGLMLARVEDAAGRIMENLATSMEKGPVAMPGGRSWEPGTRVGKARKDSRESDGSNGRP